MNKKVLIKTNKMYNTKKSLSIFKYLILTFVAAFIVAILINNL